MTLENSLKMSKISNPYQRAFLNILFTGTYLDSKIQKLLKNFELTTHQFNVLRILRGQTPGGMNATNIQTRMLHPTSNVTRIIDKLLDKQLVHRVVNKDNRRIIDVFITEKGLTLLQSIDPELEEVYTKLKLNLSADEAIQIGDLLDKMKY